MSDKTNLTNSLDELQKIVNWFDEQEEVDVEVGLTKVKEAAVLIKSSKTRLAEIENEFEAIEKEIAEDVEVSEPETSQQESSQSDDSEEVDLSQIPF